MSETPSRDSAPRRASPATATPFPDPPSSPAGPTGSSEAPTLDGIVHRIGRYEIRSLLGEGGMGRVYLAFDTELERPVALKVIHRHLVGNERILARFRQEARAVARLNHPGIVQIYEFGDAGTSGELGPQSDRPPDAPAPSTAPFLAMEYIDGRSLAGLLETRGPLALDQALRLALSAVQALDYALTQSIIHRDIKPANLLISRLGILKILDFGLARCLESDSDLTQSGSIVGSPHYMSPEQGKGERADHRSDIYSLGVTLFYMLCGVRPFEADSPLAIMLKHVQEPLPRSDRIVPLLGGRVQALLERMTAKLPDDRFQTYGDLRTELRELLALATSGASIEAPPALPAAGGPAAVSGSGASGSGPTQPYAVADLVATQVVQQRVPSADSGASATLLALPSTAAPLAASAAPPHRHLWRFAVLTLVVVVVLLGILVVYLANLNHRNVSVSRGTLAGALPSLQAASPSPEPAPGAGRGGGGRGLQAIDAGVVDRFFSVDRLEANQARILGDQQTVISEKIRKMDFAGALADLTRLRTSLEGSAEPVDTARTLGITSFISVVEEMVRFRNDIVAYIEAHAPLTIDLPGTPPRTIQVRGANEDGLVVTLVDGAAPFGKPWNENEDDPQFVYRIGVTAYGPTLNDEQRRRLTIFARYFNVPQAPGERLAPAAGALRQGQGGLGGLGGGGQRNGAGPAGGGAAGGGAAPGGAGTGGGPNGGGPAGGPRGAGAAGGVGAGAPRSEQNPPPGRNPGLARNPGGFLNRAARRDAATPGQPQPSPSPVASPAIPEH